MAITLKPLLPKPINDKAIRAELEKEIRAYGPNLVRSYEQTTAGWKGEKPKFQPRVRVTPMELSVTIALIGEKGRQKWIYLDEGTRPHVIRPKNAKVLRFPANHRPGSFPNMLISLSGSRSGPDVFAKEVHHPGTKPRNWTAQIRKIHERMFQQLMETAMARAARASGHAYSGGL